MEPIIIAAIACAALAVGLLAGRAMARPPGDVPVRSTNRSPAMVGTAAPNAIDTTAATGGGPAGASLDHARAARDAATLLEMADIGVLVIDAAGIVEAANETAGRFLSGRRIAPAGRSVMEAFTDHHAEEIIDAARTDGSATGELTVRSRDRRVLVVRARRTEAGTVLVILSDVSELRRLQRIRAEFVDNISHELRTPISTVSLLAETLEMGAGTLPPKAAERIGKIRVETEHLATMVNELLDLSSIESGTASLRIADVDLAALARQTADRLAHTAERSGITLAIQAPPDVPAVRGDLDRIGQALLNLIHNAVKFSPAGSEIRVTVTPAEAEVVVAVADRGPGIPAAARERVFERFYKVDRARTRSGGTGLGLSIARHIIEAHGGRIWVDSVEGAGSTFSFALPLGGPGLAGSPGG